MPIEPTSTFATGLNRVKNEFKWGDGEGKERAWFWTPGMLKSGGAEFSKGTSSDLMTAFTSANNWSDAARNLADEDEFLIWTQDGGYILLSGGHAYKANTATLYEVGKTLAQ